MKNRAGLGEKPARMKGNEESGGNIWTDEPPDSVETVVTGFDGEGAWVCPAAHCVLSIFRRAITIYCGVVKIREAYGKKVLASF